MKSLLKTAARRRINLIEYLNNAYEWVLPETMAEILQCSVKTVESDLEYFASEWSDCLVVENSKRYGLRMETTTHGKLEDVYAMVMQESDELAFLERVFLEPGRSSEYWMNELYHSEATFYRFLRKIDKSLAEVGLILNRQPFYLTAKDERWVRYFYAEYFFERYGARDWPFSIDRQQIYCFSLQTMTDIERNMSDRNMVMFSFLLAVILLRQQQGYFCQIEDTGAKGAVIKEILNAAKSSLEASLDAESGDELPEGWEDDLLQTVFHSYLGWDNEGEKVRITNNTRRFLEDIAQELDLPLSEADKETTVAEMIFLYTRRKFYPDLNVLFDSYQFINRDIYRFYPQFVTTFTKHLQKLEDRTNFPWASLRSKQVLHIVFTTWPDLPFLLEDRREKLSVLVYSDLHLSHRELLAKFMRTSFEFQLSVKVCRKSLPFLTTTDIEWMKQFDLIVTTSYLDFLSKDKQVVVEYLPTSRDFAQIVQKIEDENSAVHRF